MESKDIIKALECISGQASPDFDCDDCHIEKSKYTSCEVFVTEHALELIKNQQAEIEKLQSGIDDLDCKLSMANDCIAEAKTEAYKEFADRLKKRTVTFSFERGIGKFNGALVDVDDIDKTFNELTERKED